MSKRVRIEFKPTIYIDLPSDCDTEELALLEVMGKFNEMNIASVNMEIVQTDGTVHIDCADDWEIGECEIVDEED